jgi:hypothetical protein
MASPVPTFAQPSPRIVSSVAHVPSGVQHPGSCNKPAIVAPGQAAFSAPGALSGKQSMTPKLGAVKPHTFVVVQQLVA